MFGENKSNPSNYWNKESIKQFIKDNNIKTRKELQTKASGAYMAVRQFGLLNDLFGELLKHNWTEESIRQFVKDNNIKTRSELATKARSVYDTASQFGLLNDLFGEKTQWTEDSIRQFVKDNNIKTRGELQTKAIGAYYAARQFGLLYDLFGERVAIAHNKKWTEESIKKFVKDNNIKTRSELATKVGSVYKAARQLNILDKLFPKNN